MIRTYHVEVIKLLSHNPKKESNMETNRSGEERSTNNRAAILTARYMSKRLRVEFLGDRGV